MAGDRWDHVARRLEELVSADGFSGSVLVTGPSGTLLECTAGVADRGTGVAITPATRLQTASLSKMFTAATVLALVREGRLAVEDRVVDVLPAERRPRTLAGQVTLHHLLTHTSGIGDYAEEDEDLPGYVEDYGSLWRDLPVYRMEHPDDYLPLYTDAAPVGVPGGAFHYCNAGYVLLGAVIEEATGREFADVVTDAVFGPAGMTGAGYLRNDEAHADVAVSYLRRTGPGDPWRSNVFSVPVLGGGDGGANVTARDVDRFLRSIADGSLLGADLSTRMRTPHVEVAGGRAMGYGLFLRPGGGFGHGGGDPGVETMARHLPGSGVSLVVLCNEEGTLEGVWNLLDDALSA